MYDYSLLGFFGFSIILLIFMAFILLAFSLVIYLLVGKFLNDFNKLLYGKGTALAWIPFANIYLLGKLAFNKVVGWGLLILCAITSEYTITINGDTEYYSIFPGSSKIYSIAVIGLLVYAIIKYNKIKKGEISAKEAREKSDYFFGNSPSYVPNNNQTVNNTTVNENPTVSDKKYCTNCGSEVANGNKFCSNCGKEI